MAAISKKGAFGALHEDEDDWLGSYLATTKYGSDAKLNSHPVRPKKEEKKDKKVYKLQQATIKGRRKSWAANSSIGKILVPKIEVLPERVNAIRDANEADIKPPAGHFVREHRKSKEHPTEEGGEGAAGKKVARGGAVDRRRSLAYDELDAVKHRVMQAAQLWEQDQMMDEDELEDKDDSMPASSLMATDLLEPPPPLPEKTKGFGKGWLKRWPVRPTPA